MKGAWPVSVVRSAEQRAMGSLPAGALMRRAAGGLAAHCLRVLAPSAYGARVVVQAGAGYAEVSGWPGGARR